MPLVIQKTTKLLHPQKARDQSTKTLPQKIFAEMSAQTRLPKHRLTSNFEDSSKEIEKQIRFRALQQKQNIAFLINQTQQAVKQRNYEVLNFYRAPLALIDSVYQMNNLPYESEPLNIIYSENNGVNAKIQVDVSTRRNTLRSGRLLDEQQQAIYDIFDHNDDIYFVLFKEEIKLDLRKKLNRTRNGQFGYIFREDKNTYFAFITESEANHQEGRAFKGKSEVARNNNPLHIDLTSLKMYKLSFLNYVHDYNLHQLKWPPCQQNVPKSLQSMLNLFYIFSSFIWNILDYLHLKEIAKTVIHTPSTNISSQFSLSRALPSVNVVSGEDYSEEILEYRNKNAAIKASERKVKEILLNRSKKGPRKQRHRPSQESLPQESYIFVGIPFDKDTTTKKALDVPASEVEGQMLKSVSGQQQNRLGKVQYKEFFLKEKGASQAYHREWLEMRGFHLFWYLTPKDRAPRGADLLADCAIKDQGLVYGERLFSVQMMTRDLRFKLTKDTIGKHWRRILANQIAYKAFANNLWLNSKLLGSYNQMRERAQEEGMKLSSHHQATEELLVDESPMIPACLVNYFFDRRASVLFASHDALQMSLPLLYFRKERDSFIGYLSSMTKILFDSILYHQSLREIHLRGLKIGPIGLNHLFEVLMDSRIYPRISVLDLSDNLVKQGQTVISLTKFLKHINSFALTDLYLDDIKLGDRYLALISNEIAERYILFWDKKPNDLRSSMNPKNNASLEILQTISLSNVSVSEQSVSALISSIETMVKQAHSLLEVKDGMKNQQQEKVKEVIQPPGKINFLSLLDEVQNNLSDDKNEEDFSKLIGINLNLSFNNFNDSTLTSIANLIEKYDCIKNLNLSGNRNLSGSGIVKFTEIMMTTLSTKVLDLRKIQLTAYHLCEIFENLGSNYSNLQVKVTIGDHRSITYVQIFKLIFQSPKEMDEEMVDLFFNQPIDIVEIV